MKRGLTVFILSLFLISIFSMGFGLAQNDPSGRCTFDGSTFFTVESRCDGTFVATTNAGSSSDPISSIADRINPTIDKAVEIIEPIASQLLGAAPTSELLFIKLLVLILLLAILNYAITLVPGIGERPTTKWIITIILAFLAVRFLTTENLINFIWLPQGVLGITLIALLPLIIFFFFIESLNSRILRKIGWTFFAAVYFVLTIVRWEELSATGTAIGDFNLGWIYLAVGIISLLAILLDKRIRAMFVLTSLHKRANSTNVLRASRILGDIEERHRLISRLGNSLEDVRNRTAVEAEIRTLETEIARLGN